MPDFPWATVAHRCLSLTHDIERTHGAQLMFIKIVIGL